MELDRQAVERKDFPIARRGYDPVAVDAHLRTLAVQIEELQRKVLSGGTDASLASSTGMHVQTIVEAAEQAASEIERQAFDNARHVREAADNDAESIRREALDKARAHVTAVAQVANTLLERVGGMDTEVRALVDSLRAGAGRLAGDLSAVETNMAELYDAAAGRALASPPQAPVAPVAGDFDAELVSAMSAPQPPLPPMPPRAAPVPEQAPAASAPEQAHAAPAPEPPPAASAPEQAHAPPAPEPAPAGPAPEQAPAAPAPPADAEDLDGARLIALNMALNGESRADTERYLQENFHLADRETLIDEVYAAIEG
ncbi:MAG TPA: hypothetical protein VFW29_04250 [Solirubrobacteraceae bacterium]|nr:hypothetical protein [Solirubrobacteraceae bacterium]